MIASLTTMWTCHWARRRIQRYLDADPSARLTASEIRRLETHLATCARCSALTEEYRGLGRVLAIWSADHGPDPAAVARLRASAEQLLTESAG